MAINLLDQLMNRTPVTPNDVDSAQSALKDEPPQVILEGVNAPEFEESVSFDMEDAYAQQPQERKGIKLPRHDDGLDDDDSDLMTPDHAIEADQNILDSMPWSGEIIDPLTNEVIMTEGKDEYQAWEAGDHMGASTSNSAQTSAESEDLGEEPEAKPKGMFPVLNLEGVDAEVLERASQRAESEQTDVQSTTVEETQSPYLAYRAAKFDAHDMASQAVYEGVAWYNLPWNARFLNLTKRTRNALHASHLRNFSDLRFTSLSSLKKLKGFGKKALEELNLIYEDLGEDARADTLSHCGIGTLASLVYGDILSPKEVALHRTLDEQGLEDLQEYRAHVASWFEVGRLKCTPAEPKEPVAEPAPAVEEAPGEVEQRPFPMTQEQCDDLMAQNSLPADPAPAVEEAPIEVVEPAPVAENGSDYSEAYVVLKREYGAFEPVFTSRSRDACRAYAVTECSDVPNRIKAVRTDEVEISAEPSLDDPAESSNPTDVSEPPEPEVKSEEVRSTKILVIGGSASLTRPGLKVASFDQVYAEAVRVVCEQSSVPSIASIDFGKGWGSLSTLIRMGGWPDGIDVLVVSKGMMSRAEVMLELRLLADLVVEA